MSGGPTWLSLVLAVFCTARGTRRLTLHIGLQLHSAPCSIVMYFVIISSYCLTICIHDLDITSLSTQLHHNVTAHYTFLCLFCASSERTIHPTCCFSSVLTLPLHTFYTQLWHRLRTKTVLFRNSMTTVYRCSHLGSLSWILSDHGLWLWNNLGGVLKCFYGMRNLCRSCSTDPSTLWFCDNNFISCMALYPAVFLMNSISCGSFHLLLFPVWVVQIL